MRQPNFNTHLSQNCDKFPVGFGGLQTSTVSTLLEVRVSCRHFLPQALIYLSGHTKSALALRLCQGRASFSRLTDLRNIKKGVKSVETSTSNKPANIVVHSGTRNWYATWMLLEMSALKAMANDHQSQQYCLEFFMAVANENNYMSLNYIEDQMCKTVGSTTWDKVMLTRSWRSKILEFVSSLEISRGISVRLATGEAFFNGFLTCFTFVWQ